MFILYNAFKSLVKIFLTESEYMSEHAYGHPHFFAIEFKDISFAKNKVVINE